MAGNNSNTLVDEKLAVSLFLDSLLREPETETETELATAEIKPVLEIPVIDSTIVEPVSKIKLEIPVTDSTIVEPVSKVKFEIPVEVENLVEPKVEETTNEDVVVDNKITTPIKTESAAEPIVPEWANEPFQILLFEVAGLKLAVPLIELCGVIEWNDSVTEMPGHADFYMGILQHLDYKIAVIDTAKMVLPPDKLLQFAGENPRQRVNHIVLIDDYRWGLACDNIGEVITLKPDDVRWRTSKTSRGWLAGTVIEHMCALLNSEGFSTMLEQGQQASD